MNKISVYVLLLGGFALGCGSNTDGGNSGVTDQDAAPTAGCSQIPAANAACWSCVAGVIKKASDGTLCGGLASNPEHGECVCGVCSWTNYGADPCGGVPDKKPCMNGRGVCYEGACVPEDAGC